MLSTRQKALLRPLLIAHAQRQQEYFNRAGADEDERISDKLYDAVCAAENRLMSTPAPTAAALAFKSALAYREADDAKLGFDDIGAICHALHGYAGERQIIQTHMDLLRLAAIDHPILHLEDFAPREWIDAFEEAGGLVSCEVGDALLLFGPRLPHQAAVADRLLSELSATPWKYRAVERRASSRRYEGGDALFPPNNGPAGEVIRHRTSLLRVVFTQEGGQVVPIPTAYARVKGEWVEARAGAVPADVERVLEAAE